MVKFTKFLHMGNPIKPFYVVFTNEERLVGDTAKYQEAMNPVFDAKHTIHKDMQHWPFKVARGDADRESKQFYPEEVAGALFK